MFFLGTYAAMPIMIVVFLLLLVILSLNIDEEKSSFICIKTVWTTGAVLLVSSILGSYFFYQSAKTELKKHFLENGTILCTHKKENVIIQKDTNYTLKDDYFIKNSVAIDIDSCKSLKDHQ